MTLPRKRLLSILLVPLGLLLTLFAQHNRAVVEKFYSRGFYLFLSRLVGGIMNAFPFSMAEIVLVGSICVAIGFLVSGIKKVVRSKGKRREILLSLGATAACAASLVYFGFVILCGLNYHRISFAQQSGLKVRQSSPQELSTLVAELVENANQSRRAVEVSADGTMTLSRRMYDTAKISPQVFANIAETYPQLGGWAPRAKPARLSRSMSYLDIVGVYFPFTFEANINKDVPHYSIPSSMAHELAHYKGFMQEEEANFISYLACTTSQEPDFVYSGYMLALVHSMNALYQADKDLYWEATAGISKEVRLDLDANGRYWQRFAGPVAEVSSKVNDLYLKSNKQTEGVRSYGAVVDLLLAEYRMRHNLDA